MNNQEIAEIDKHTNLDGKEWFSIIIFNKSTKRKVSEYGPFYSQSSLERFAKANEIKL